LSRAGRAVCYVVVAVGLALRLLQLLANRSLSQDEAMLALNIVHRSYSGFLRQLDFLQGAPFGFLMIQRLVVDALGNDEYSLRLLPFIVGSLALVLIVFLARENLLPAAVPLAAVALAVSDPLINWTVYAKPYSGDVLASVVVLLVGLRALHQPANPSVLVTFAAVGALAVWLSYASVFVLAGVSTALLSGALVRKEWRGAALIAAASSAWLVSFGVFGFTLLRNLSSLQSIDCVNCFAGGGGGGSGAGPSTSGLHSLRATFGEFRYVSGVPHLLDRGNYDAGLLIFFLAVGFCALGVWNLAVRQPETGLALVAPLIFALIAWALHKYPMFGRTQLFLIPNFVLLLAQGMAYAFATAARLSVRVVTGGCVAIVLLAMAAPSLGHIAHPRRFEDLKPVLGYLATRERPGDTLYVYYAAQYQLRYYLECRCAGTAFETARRSGLWPIRRGPGGPAEFAPALLSVLPQFIIAPYRGRDSSNYLSDLDALRGRKRAWFLLSSLEQDRRKFLLDALDQRGTRLDAFSVGKGKDAAAVFLYDMTRPGRR
jgi:hypothetical protein